MRAGAQRWPGGGDQSRHRAGGKTGDGAVGRSRAPRSRGNEVTLSFRGASKTRTSDVQLHIGESRDSPMRNCASEVWSFGPSRNDLVDSCPPVIAVFEFPANQPWIDPTMNVSAYLKPAAAV